MSFSFHLDKPDDLAYALSKVKSEASKNNIKFTGDETQGSASGWGFAGEYKVHANSIEIIVNQKPLIVSKARIQEVAQKALAQIDSQK
jgi:hypothetical protein